jgi:hypothetical protein
MWKSEIEIVDLRKTQRVKIFLEDKQLTYKEIIQGWKDNAMFRDFYISLLIESPFQSFFWESTAVTRASVHQPYEFVLVDSPQLWMVKPNSSPFANYLEATKDDASVVVFENLGKDAVLVVPRKHTNQTAYTHFAAFIRNAPNAQHHELFQRIGEALEERLSDQPLWVSTSGLGVYWLHIRLDFRPKYYSYLPYK